MSRSEFPFTIEANDSSTKARACCLETPHGSLNTPVFMPVGTHATVKGVLPAQLEELGAQILLANTYHLFLRPGSELIERAGGLHEFMNWSHPILTDSGGFQLFSLAETLKVDDDGVSFASILDGSKHRWTPEDNMLIQNQLGADIIMQLDQCPPYPCEKEKVALAVERSASWASRCRTAQKNPQQALFAIVQGGTHLDLRLESVSRLLVLEEKDGPFEGFGIGGYSVGEPHEVMFETLGTVAAALPQDRPRYLMGVGNPSTLLKAISVGIDMFDCVLPTRTARMGTAFTSEGKLNLRNARFASDLTPLDTQCSCSVCQGFSRAYIRHLILSKEILASVLLSVHNLHFLIHLMGQARNAILSDSYSSFLTTWNDSPASHDF
jgi:queuine tRNA-ribosyltransferase